MVNAREISLFSPFWGKEHLQVSILFLAIQEKLKCIEDNFWSVILAFYTYKRFKSIMLLFDMIQIVRMCNVVKYWVIFVFY